MLDQPVELPCGAVLKNRLAKSPMSDSLGDGRGNPTQTQIRLYERWAQGGAALSVIGEVQVTSSYPEKPGNLVLGKSSDNDLLQQLTRCARVNAAHLWPQIGHAGALSHLPISQPKGPSALRIDRFECAGMSLEEVEALPELYAQAAAHARSVGFSGVMIHAGHGFLLSQFLSPLFNRRNDGYGGSIEARARIVVAIIQSVRASVGAEFPVAIRINSSDQLEGGLSEEDSLELIRMLDDTSIDLIDISGGTYFPGARSSSDRSSSGPYFVDFAARARAVTLRPLMVTGGFKQRQQAIDALESAGVDIIGVGRAMALAPSLPSYWLGDSNNDPEFPRFDSTVPGGVTAWYTMRLKALGEDKEDRFDLTLDEALQQYEARDAQRCRLWNEKFGHS